MDPIRPTGITANRNTSELTIQWNDDHTSVYSFTLLRKACPCAECRGGHENMGGEPDPEVFLIPPEDTPATRLRNLEAVGSYAITPQWEDGHNFGIYNWRFLRRLCPCPVCRAVQGTA
ncbi:MAG TPA: DUF971 domain-containing protein [Anaerolineales bacterium]|nr:DUF971 domain-containing protein [Anaerolineales bacterium]